MSHDRESPKVIRDADMHQFKSNSRQRYNVTVLDRTYKYIRDKKPSSNQQQPLSQSESQLKLGTYSRGVQYV